MQFEVGDTVFHPVHGVGHITAISENRFVGNQNRQYYEVATEKSTIWVPIEASATIGLRRVTVKRDLARYRSVLKSHPTWLDDDHGKRRLYIANRLKEGSLDVACQVVRDLTARGWNKRLTQVDTIALRKVREGLDQEWAAAEGVSIAEATQEIDALLLEGRQAYMS